jgi:hypothetical protein
MPVHHHPDVAGETIAVQVVEEPALVDPIEKT